MIKRFAFLGLILALKIYLYVQLVRFFERPLYKRLALALAVVSFVATGIGIYAIVERFATSMTHSTPGVNYAIGIMVSFAVLDVIMGVFFVLDDVWGGAQRLYHLTAQSETPRASGDSFSNERGCLLLRCPLLLFCTALLWANTTLPYTTRN